MYNVLCYLLHLKTHSNTVNFTATDRKDSDAELGSKRDPGSKSLRGSTPGMASLRYERVRTC